MNFYQVCDNGYKYDRRIFWGVMGILVTIFMALAYQNNFNLDYQFYFKCDQYSCLNPIMDPNSFQYNSITGQDNKAYCTASWCNELYLPRGEYGKSRPWIFKNFETIAILLVLAGLVLNHVIHNRGITPSVKLAIPDKWNKKLREIKKRLDEEGD